MNNKIYNARYALIRQKNFYAVLITIMLLSFISGVVLIFFIDKTNKNNVIKNVTLFFNNIKFSNGINYSNSFFNTTVSNLGYAILIWILGISLIGFPIIILILIFKSFILGFSISSIIATYGFKGLLGSFLYVFPHQIILIIIYMLLCFYSLTFCYRLFSNLFLKKDINLKLMMNKYIKVFWFSLCSVFIVSLYEVFLSTYFIKFFTLFIK